MVPSCMSPVTWNVLRTLVVGDAVMRFELFKEVAPMTVENFRALATGESGPSKKQSIPVACAADCRCSLEGKVSKA